MLAGMLLSIPHLHARSTSIRRAKTHPMVSKTEYFFPHSAQPHPSLESTGLLSCRKPIGSTMDQTMHLAMRGRCQLLTPLGAIGMEAQKASLQNYQAGKRYPHVGANDTQGNAIVHMVPIVAALAGKPGMLGEVEKLIRVTQDTDKAVAFGLAGARVLSKVIGGSSLLQAVQSTAEDLKDPTREHPNSEDMALASGLEKMLGQLDRPTIDVTKEVGQSCDYPFGLWSGSHLAAQLSATATANATEAFMLGTRQLIEAGGDSGSRGAFVGALLGAVAGEQGIPAAWKQKYLHYDDVLTNAKKLLQAQVVV